MRGEKVVDKTDGRESVLFKTQYGNLSFIVSQAGLVHVNAM